MKKHWQHLFLLLGFTLLPLYFFEGFLSLMSPGYPFAAQSLKAAQAQARFAGVELSLPIYGFNLGYPIRMLAGYGNTEVVFCRSQKQWQTYHSDSFGFPNPEEVWRATRAEAVLLGDSYLVGNCLPEPQRLATLIQKQIPNVINLGMGNSGPAHALARLVEYGLPKRTKRILYFYTEGNDLEDSAREADIPELIRYVENPYYRVGNYEKNQEIQKAAKDWAESHLDDASFRWERYATLGKTRAFIENWKEHYKVSEWESGLKAEINSPKEYLSYLSWIGPKVESERLYLAMHPNFQKSLDRMAQVAGTMGAALYLVYLPESKIRRWSVSEEVLQYARKKGFRIINMREIFEKKNLSPWSGYPSDHYNEVGNELVAEAVIATLRKQ